MANDLFFHKLHRFSHCWHGNFWNTRWRSSNTFVINHIFSELINACEPIGCETKMTRFDRNWNLYKLCIAIMQSGLKQRRKLCTRKQREKDRARGKIGSVCANVCIFSIGRSCRTLIGFACRTLMIQKQCILVNVVRWTAKTSKVLVVGLAIERCDKIDTTTRTTVNGHKPLRMSDAKFSVGTQPKRHSCHNFSSSLSRFYPK